VIDRNEGSRPDVVRPYEVRRARPDDAHQIGAVCAEGFRASSRGLLTPETIQHRVDEYYSPSRVLRDIRDGDASSRWQGYVVAAAADRSVVGAGGGGVRAGTRGEVLVLYLSLHLRGRGVGTSLLDFLTEQQRDAGAREQWVTVTAGNELAIPFYRARGFVERERVPFVDGALSLRMSRPL
jgi:ribosomal protein S18 acetylase RimI-like enzyme